MIKREDEFFVEPILEDYQIGPTGIDLRLDSFFMETKHTGEGIISPDKRTDPYESTQSIEVDIFGGNAYTLQPGEFVIGQTFEYVYFPDNLFGIIDGRSSLGRLGVVVHSTASSVDPGWEGHLTLELHNDGKMPVTLLPLMRVARLILFEISKVAGYSKQEISEVKYLRQFRPRPSKIFEDRDIPKIASIRKGARDKGKDLASKLLGAN